MQSVRSAAICVVVIAGMGLAQDPRWPRQITQNGTTLTIYHPQVDSWKDFKELDWRMAISLTPPDGKPAVGVAVLHAHTEVNPEADAVQLTNITLKGTIFPSADPATAAQLNELVKQFIPPVLSTSMRRLIACVPKQDAAPTVSVLNDAPPIYVSYAPAILLYVDGPPQYAPIRDTKLEFVVNTAWPLFRDTANSQFYLLAGKQWMTASALQGPWMPAARLPKDMDHLPADSAWASLRSVIPPPVTANPIIPAVFIQPCHRRSSCLTARRFTRPFPERGFLTRQTPTVTCSSTLRPGPITI